MLAICSDLDETPDARIYFETARYLNTTDKTLLGKGVGLEVGNTIYFDMPQGQFSYTNTDDIGRKGVHQLIDSGHIDCLHSFGDFVKQRDQIETYWSKIQSGKKKIEVWVDHAQAPTNFDNDIMKGQGAEQGAAAYHADLTAKSGALQFIWKGRVTSLIAQNVSRSYRGLLNIRQLKASFKTLLLEFIKGWLARFGSEKYAMHQKNHVLRKTHLVDGSVVTEFMRCNPSWAGVSVFDTARGIHNVLTQKVLNTLVDKKGASIFYSHLGKVESSRTPFSPKTVQAFELLAEYQQQKKILTATTRRLLGYLRTAESLSFQVVDRAGKQIIEVQTAYQGEDLQGLTWYVDEPEKCELYINGSKFSDYKINPSDETGKTSISISWKPLTFPTLSESL